jgi:hypothetical protein
MSNPNKFWWHGEPLVVGSVRYRIIANDMFSGMRVLLRELRELQEVGRGLTTAATGRRKTKR